MHSAFNSSVINEHAVKGIYSWYLEDQDHLPFGLCSGTETKDDTLARTLLEGDNTPIAIQPPFPSAGKDFQDSPDEEDTRNSQEYMNDLKEEYQARALLAKSKRFFEKGTQKFSTAKVTDQTECHKSGKMGHFARDSESYEWDEEEVSSDENEIVELKVHMALADEENAIVGKDSAKNREWVKIALIKLSEAEGSILPNHDTEIILLAESQTNITDSLVDVIHSSTTEHESTDESSVCSNSLPLLEKLAEAEPISGPKTVISILKSNSTSKTEVLKGVTIKEPQSARAKSKASASKANSNLAGKLKGIKTKDDPPLANNDIRKPIWYLDSRCSRHMTVVKNYLHKYMEQPGPKVVFGDDSTCITEGYGSIKCNGIVFTKVAFVNGLKYNLVSISQLCNAKYIVQFDEKKGIIFNSNKEVVMIAPRVKDVYVLDMTSSAQESCFFAKATENLNWLWHKSLSRLNFKTINQLAIQNLLLVFPHLSINHEKYTLVIVDEYSKYTWVYFLKKKSQASETIMSFIKRVENQNDIKVKQLRTDNGTEFRKNILINFYDEKGITQKISSPYTPEQNGVAERKNRTLIEAARTMLSGYVFSKQYWIEAIATACYTQNRSTIVKRHLKTPYEIFCERIPNTDFLHVFGCLVYIHNHKDYLGKFDEKSDDGYFLGYSLVSKASRVFNTRRQQTKETYHITFDESPDAIKFTKPTDDYLIFLDSVTYQPDEFPHSYEPSQKYQVYSNIAPFIDPYKSPEPNINKSSYQIDQNDHPIQNDEILNDDQTKHSIQDNDNNIIENLTTNEIGQNSESSPSAKDASDTNTSPIQDNPSVSTPNTPSPAPQDKWTQNKHIKLVNIIGNLGFGMLTRAMAKELGAASAHECLFVDFFQKKNEKRYLKGTPSLGLWYPKCSGFDLKGYSDSDYAGCNMDKKSTSGACQLLGGKLVCWSAKKQQSVAMSSAKAKYVASAGCCANILWIKSQLTDYDIIYEKVPIFCDNTNHILKGDIELHFIPTQYQLADIFTKPLDEPSFKGLIVELGMLNIEETKPEASNNRRLQHF
ncbi:retrovirus-related pol polyprotein from transposon TNT 1-94 [Tanacetum coccineum]